MILEPPSMPRPTKHPGIQTKTNTGEPNTVPNRQHTTEETMHHP
jgi:hypothetical protein